MKQSKGFSLIELIAVIAIIAILAQLVQIAFLNIQKARIATALSTQDRLRNGIVQYYTDVGFLPPDVNRGWDPGMVKPLPYNPDTIQDCNINVSDCPTPAGYPANWRLQVLASWRGPYMSKWPTASPWGGKYDYNLWDAATVRSGCLVAAGVYVGIQGDYSNNHTVPVDAEQIMTTKGFDADRCTNGEVQLLIPIR